MPINNRLKIMLAVIVVAIIAMLSIDPIAQEPGYHNFADQRHIINIAHFFNVLSNLPFVIIGIAGIRLVALRQATGGLAELQTLYLTFFVGGVSNRFRFYLLPLPAQQSTPTLGSPADDVCLRDFI